MDHKAARKRLSEYIDGAITDEERAAIDAHLESCTNCRDALAELLKAIGHIKRIEDVDPPPWMTSRIMAHVREEAEKKWSWRRLLSPAMLRPAMSGVAIAFVAAVAIYVYQNIQPEVSFEETAPPPPAMTPRDEGKAFVPERAAEGVRPKVPPPPKFEAAKDRTVKDEAIGLAPPPAPAPAMEAAPEPVQTAPMGAAAQTARPPERTEERIAPQKAATEREAKISTFHFALVAKDPAAAATTIERRIAELGGIVKASRVSGAGHTIRAGIPASKLPGLSQALGHAGHITARPPTTGNVEGTIEVLITISPE